jgi:hypothetical protein
MLLIKPGTKIFIGEHFSRKATVETVQIGRGDVISYNVSFWDDNDKMTAWVDSTEVSNPEGMGSMMDVRLSLQ